MSASRCNYGEAKIAYPVDIISPVLIGATKELFYDIAVLQYSCSTLGILLGNLIQFYVLLAR